MFHKILVALDKSDMGASVLEKAVSLAKQMDACLMLLHVLSSDEDGSPVFPGFYGLEYYPGLHSDALDAYQRQWESYKQEGIDFLRLRTEEAIAQGIPTEFTQNAGSPGVTICNLAKTWGADLIVLGRRGRSSISELLLGSVSNYVLHHASCSVLTVHRSSCTTSDSVQPEAAQVASR
ncbi:MAG: universal stress protein [Leptolyngbyaceae cyanobacterium RM2_2_4]|nr:universal stress protein [Leptolyngbyaceae cyanobacterium SM1_4_3]NJO52526.1 universal stress protein [Leptolyngbyaceae cyanobacterium RM2_2_4]NJO66406.1 universal stress protein [Leptolyngbyaceae cyanobacterium RM1_405_57]